MSTTTQSEEQKQTFSYSHPTIIETNLFDSIKLYLGIPAAEKHFKSKAMDARRLMSPKWEVVEVCVTICH